MRNIKRISLALLLCVLMLVQCVAVFAEVSPVVYKVGDDGSVTSYVYARNLTNKAKLYTAVYNADGSFAFATASAQADKAGYLKTTVTPAEGQVVKSFIWDKANTPFGGKAEYASGVDMDDVSITLNGKDLREYLTEDETFGLNKSYDINIFENGFHTVPVVRVSSKDSQLETTVEYSEDYSSATVAFKKGARETEVTEITTNTSAKFDIERYSKEELGTVTVNFKKDYLNDDDLVGSPAGGLYNSYDLSYHYAKEYTLGTGEASKQISLTFPTFGYQTTLLVIEPLDGVKTEDALCNADGSAIEWLDDNGVKTGHSVKTFDYDDYAVEEYHKINTTAVTSNTIEVAAVKQLRFGDNARENGGRFTTSRNCALEGFQIYGADTYKSEAANQNSSLTDCNYLCFESNSNKTSNIDCTFYVNKSVRVHAFFRKASDGSNILTSVSDSDGTWGDSLKQSGKLMIRYQNAMDPVSVAYLIRNGYLREADVTYRRNDNVAYDANGNGVKESATESLKKLYAAGLVPDIVTGDGFSGYSYYRYDAADKIKEISGSDAGYGYDNGFGVVDIPNSLFPYYYSETYTYQDYLDKWSDWEYNKELPPLVTNLAAPATVHVEDMPMLCNSNDAATGSIKGTQYTYTGDVPVFTSQVKIVNFLGDSVAADRNGLSLNDKGAYRQNGNGGALISYPDGFGLEDATYIAYSFGVINDASFRYGSKGYWNGNGEGLHKPSYHDVWINTKDIYPFYSFDVTRDAEVIVFATNDIAFLANDGYNKITLANDDGIKTARNMNTGYRYDFTRAYVKNFPAGSKVEMKTGQGDRIYCVFVKEAKVTEADTSLKSISVDGVEIADFDPEVKTYSVELTDPSKLTAPVVTATANDANAKVYVTPATDFPGTTTIEVVHANGFSDRYTINHTYSGDMISDLKVMDGSWVIPKELFAYVTTTDATTGETVPKYPNDFKMATADKPAYYRNGLVIGGYVFNGRTTTITAINDPSIVGKDIIIPGMEWYNGGQTSMAFQGSGRAGGTHIDNWLNFNLKRKATIKIMMASPSTIFEKTLTSQGYIKKTSNVNFFDASPIVRNRRAMFTKTFDGNTTVNIPNGNVYANDAYTIVIDYADYE